MALPTSAFLHGGQTVQLDFAQIGWASRNLNLETKIHYILQKFKYKKTKRDVDKKESITISENKTNNHLRICVITEWQFPLPAWKIYKSSRMQCTKGI